MSNSNEKACLTKGAPYEEIRGSKLNHALSWPARILICVLALMMFLAMSNPAQTATLGRASLAQLAAGGKSSLEIRAAGLDALQTTYARMQELVDKLETAAALLDVRSQELRDAIGKTEAHPARVATESALAAMQEAEAALDSTLRAEMEACEETLALNLTDKMTYLGNAVTALQTATDAMAALQADPENEELAFTFEMEASNALSAISEISWFVTDLMGFADEKAELLTRALWPDDPGDTTLMGRLENLLPEVSASVNEKYAEVAAENEVLVVRQAQASEVLEANQAALNAVEAAVANVQTVLTETQTVIRTADRAVQDTKNPSKKQTTEMAEATMAAADTALKALDAQMAQAESAMKACAEALRAAEGPSSIAGTELAADPSPTLTAYARVYLAVVAVGLVGMVMTLGNNRMRKVGLPVLALGGIGALIVLYLFHGVHAGIAGNVETLRAAHVLAPVSEEMEAVLATLAQDIPDAMWVHAAVAGLTVLFAAAAWLTLPREMEDRMQIDLLTIFQRTTRVLVVVTGLLVFLPNVNPGRVSSMINENASLFTMATSYGTIIEKLKPAITNNIISEGVIRTLMMGSAVVLLGILINAAGACMSLGNNRMKKKGGYVLPMAGSAAILVGLFIIFNVYNKIMNVAVANSQDYAMLQPMLPGSLIFWAVAAVLVFVCSFVSWYLLPDELEEQMEMEEKYRNFLMFLPVLLLTFIFCYLPIWGWRFAFFDYKIGDQLLLYDTVVDGVVTKESTYVGLKWFTHLFENAATRDDLIRVLRNTLVMSGLGIATSWLPIAFAVLLAEVRSSKFQRVVQTLTTIPNFISWVLVYAIAFAIFSTDGFINSFLRNVVGLTGANTDYLANADWIWVKMLLWGTWKGLGWSAIVYIAGIAGIDQQLYEAARVDGANRFQCIRHITIPGLVPTYMVMLLMSVAGMLSNGMDQYLVFENPINSDVIEVLDLYVYNSGIRNGLIPLSTVVGVFKSLIGVTLLFGANGISKAIRGESII